jgi:NAD(P)-dependent dehydrogenase (short-subunit alcohol dehydrogenase family)
VTAMFVVTGAARGIGREVVRRLRGEGHRVAGLLRAGGSRMRTDALDARLELELSRPDELAAALAAFAADLGPVEGLVHSAGVVRGGDLQHTTAADYTLQFAVNVTAVAEITRALLPNLRQAAGTVVLVNSGSGLTARTPLGGYAASKFALRAYADSLRQEEPGIRVSSIYPGRVATDMQVEVRMLEGAEYRPEEYLEVGTVAEAVLTLLRLPSDGTITDLTLRPWTGRGHG